MEQDTELEELTKQTQETQWRNIVKPVMCLMARLNAISDSFAFHFVTGEGALAGRYAGDEYRVFGEPYPPSAVAIKDFLTKVPDINAMRAGLYMLQCALSTQCRHDDVNWDGSGLAQIGTDDPWVRDLGGASLAERRKMEQR